MAPTDKKDRSWLDKKDNQEKLSWREMDARKNKSRFVSDDSQSKPESFESRRANSQAMAALNEFFSGKKSKEQAIEWKKVLDGKGKTFSTRATKYVEKFSHPYEWDDLLRLLDHDDPLFVATVLDKMLERAPGETELRKDLLVGKLRVLKMERDESDLIAKFEGALTRLSQLGG